MDNPLVRKLEHGARLTDEDRSLLVRICKQPIRVPAYTDLIREGDPPRNVRLVIEGFAGRYKVLENGKRQIVAFFVPGDMCDLHVHILGEMDHNIGTLVDSLIVEIEPQQVDALIDNPRLNRALWWATLVDEAILREWLVNMGQRPASAQMGHIFCELLLRLQVVGRAGPDSFPMLLTQQELADTMGITPVHVNRVIKELRELGLVETSSRRVRIPDIRKLREFSGFDPTYLHLHNAGSRKPAAIDEAAVAAP